MADYTYASVFWMYSLMGMLVVGAAFFLVKAVRSGAVRDDEAPKYRMLEDDEALPGAAAREALEGGHDGDRP